MTMKKFCLVICLLVAGVVAAPSAKAQIADTMTVPFGCFEQWNTYPGDSLTLMMLPIPINDGYTLPEGWDIPRYNIDDTVTVMGMPMPINTSIPLAKVYRDSVNAPEGSSALVAQTFTFEDVLSPMAYSLASQFLDTDLVNTVIPTIVSTGYVDVNRVLPLMEQILDDPDDLSWMLDLLDTADFNNYISGGFPLNGFQPGRLLGYYKYIYDHSHPQRDYGAIVAIGTRYDSINHRRTIVGAGSKNLFQLYDTVYYEPFYMDYFPIGDYLPDGYEYSEADSMIVLVISSVGEKERYRGSRLFVDSLQLVQFPGPCGRVENLRETFHDYYRVELAWNNSATPDRWEVEYGRSGFMVGYGTVRTVTDSSFVVTGLDELTTYDFYVRALCGDSAETPRVFISVTTDSIPRPDPPIGIADIDEASISLRPNPAQGRCVVDFGGVMVEHLRLFTVDGRIVKDVAVKGESIEIELPHTGVYIIELQTAQGLVHKRLVNK